MAILIVLALLGVVGIVATCGAVPRDGYRRIPTRDS
ncbi:hypothetical protein BH11ACT4_BH11ACT4_02300 [soil metagenome]